MIKTSEALQKLYHQYTHLPIGGKEIVCPYWMNDIKKGIWGILGGKGRPEEIVQATNEEAAKKNINLNHCSEKEILTFMQENKIGVDCSGFVFWMLDELDREKKGNGIADDIPNSKGKYLKARASARMLTSSEVATGVDLEKLTVGDMIRFKKGNHIAIVLEVFFENIPQRVTLAHSSLGKGVHQSLMETINPKKSLREQKWSEPGLAETLDFANQDGIKRLKIWQ